MKLIYIITAIIAGEVAVDGYRYGVGPFKRLNYMQMKKLDGNAPDYSMYKISRLNGSPLEGKNVLFLGSSVTYGAASLGEGIPEYFAARCGCDITKEAVSGTTLTDDNNKSYVFRLLNNVDPHTDHDLAVIQLSTNDAGKNKPMGEICFAGSSMKDYDRHTITGSIETIIEYVRKIWDCPVVFYTNCRYDSESYAVMIQRLYEIKEKWNIGIIDLWSDDIFNSISEEERALYMYDPVHPTKAGYLKWWCPEMERQLLKILAE